MFTYGDASECYSIYIRYDCHEKTASSSFWDFTKCVTRSERFGWVADFR